MAFPWCTKAGGMALAFPDVCKIPAPPAPPIPVPFPNIAQLAQATKTSKKVKVINQPVVTIASEIGKTQGDEAGTLKGVSSSTNMDLLLLAITDQALRWAARSRVSPAVGHLQAWLLAPTLCEKMPGIHDGDSNARLASAAARS